MTTTQALVNLFAAMRRGDREAAMDACSDCLGALVTGSPLPTLIEVESALTARSDEKAPECLLAEIASDLEEPSIEALIETYRVAEKVPAICFEPDCWTVVLDVMPKTENATCVGCGRPTMVSMDVLAERMKA